MGATEDWLASIGNTTGAKTALVLSADPRSPDELAGHAKIGAQLGLPPVVIGSDPEAFKARAAEKSIADAVKDAPKTAAWLQDRDNGGIAKDDVANLSWFEKGLKDWEASGDTGVSRAIVRGTKSLAGSMQGFGAIQSAITAADIGLTKEQIIAREVAALGPNPDVSMVAAAQQAALIKYDAVSGMTEEEKAAMLQGASGRLQIARDTLAKAAAIPRSGIAQEGADTWAAAPNTLMGKLGTIAQNPAAVLAFLGETAAESLPALIPATVATLATRSPVVGAGVMGATSGYLTASTEAMGFLESRGIKMETPDDVLAVLSNQELMLEARQYGLDKGLIVGALDALSGGVAGKTLMKSPVGEAIAQSAAQALFGGGGEALAQLAVDGQLDWGAVLIEGLAEFVTAPAEMVSVGRGWLKSSAEKAARAGTTAGKIEAIDKMAAESKVKARSPEKMADLLDRVMDGKSLYVPADDLNELFQAKDFGPADWGIDPATFEETLAAGGDIAVPVATYASKITGTDNADWFKENAKTVIGEMSAVEARRFNEEVRGIVDAQMAAADADRMAMLESRASDVQVKDQLYTMLRSAGQTRDVADTNARVVAAAIRTMAQRSGQDPLDMAQRFGLDIKGPQTNEMRRRGNLDIALNTLRKGAVQKPGASLMDFVIGNGGLQDTGGDLAAMDAPKGVIAETRDEVMARTSQPSLLGLPAIGKGKGLDDMARAAIEAGYFPDLQSKPEDNLANVLMDALRAEMAGQKRFIPGQEGDVDLQNLAAELDRRGIDLAASNDEIAAKLLESDGKTFFQKYLLGQQNRASIIFPAGGVDNGQSVINMFENSDLSSFQHEIGHYMLEVFNVLAGEDSAPQDMRDDMAAIQKYLGMEPGAKPTVEQHELFARTWEAYLMEGKSPTLELADAFARFKAWMVRIYQTVSGLKVKINPEIRAVMDRMIATDEEIRAARAEQAMKPLFTDETAAGMTPGAFQTYQRMARRATEQAEQSLLEKTMAVVRRKMEAWWKAEYKQVLDQVTKSINSQRPYRLTEMLANQVWLSDTPRDVPDMQIDRKQLVDMFGAGVLAELSREKLGGKRAIYKDGGASPMEVADLFGFANPQEMVDILQNAGKRKDAIRAETDRIMRDRYGDPLTDGSIESAALEAIHSEQQAMTVASEVRHLAVRAGVSTRNLTAQVFRQRARLMLGRMTVSEAGNPNAFLAAGRKAAKRAEDAFARVAGGKDSQDALMAATRHKEQQLLNHYLYLESRDFARELDSGREKMRGYTKASVRAKLEGGYIEQIDTLLDAYDFRVQSKKQVARAESLTAFVQRMTDAGRAGELAIDQRVIDRAKKVHYSRLSVDELRGLFDTIANIDHLGRFKQKLIDAAEQRDHDAVVDGVLAEFDANVKPSPPSRTPDAGERAAKKGRDYLNSVLNADTLLRVIDGFKDLGPTWTAMKAKIDQGMFRLTERRKAMGEAFDKIYSAYSLAEKRDMSAKKQNAALGIPMSKWDLIALALNTGNNDNFERLTNPKSPGHFDAAGIQSALAELTERDWATVQATWDYINSFWPEIAAKEKRQTGVAPKKVEAKLMVNAPAGVTGGYYPIRYDGRLSGLTQDFSQKEMADSLMGGMFGKAQTRNGHTESRVSTTKQPILLDLAVGHQHVEQVIYDLEIGEAVAGSWKVLHDGRIRSAFINAGKQSDWDALEIWQQDVASGDRAAAGGVQSMMRMLRTGFTFSRLAFNISTALIQPSGLVQSAVVIGKEAVAKGTISYMQNPARWVREVTAVSSLMRERKMTFERDINNAVGDLALSQDGTSWVSKSANWVSPVLGNAVVGTSMRWQKFQRDVLIPASFWMMQSVQFYAVDMPTWVSAYQKELAASGDETKARTYADTITKRAQGSGLISDRGMLERGTLNRNSRQQELPKLLTALGSYMFAKGNVAYEQAMKTDFKNPVQVMSFAVDIALLFTLEAVLYAAVKGGLPGDDEEPADWAAWLAKQTLFSAMSTLPGFRELSGAMQGYGGGGVLGSSIEVMARPFIQAGQGDYDKSAVKAFTDAAGITLHLPSAQIKNIIENMFEADMSVKASPDFGGMAMGGKGRTLADMLFGD